MEISQSPSVMFWVLLIYILLDREPRYRDIEVVVVVHRRELNISLEQRVPRIKQKHRMEGICYHL